MIADTFDSTSGRDYIRVLTLITHRSENASGLGESCEHYLPSRARCAPGFLYSDLTKDAY